jgi:GH25 family lysozyme M1 (1,4-beta-N-acetylmuramidase)
MSDFLLGTDVSKWQGDMNWEKADSAGANFAFIRAGSIDNISGNCYTD